ncbi:MAG: hypothetical protein GX175_12085 [Halanaerobiaceae bacterium]|nr:hypothetical protein [Halanaerobiaceae bacterium]
MIKVLKHISFARDWLDRAENEIKIGSIVNGEVYLSLAEAEIRKAWENSYFSRQKEVENRYPLLKSLPVILGILLIFIAVFANRLFTPLDNSVPLELKLSDESSLRENIYWGYREIKLISDNLLIENN